MIVAYDRTGVSDDSACDVRKSLMAQRTVIRCYQYFGQGKSFSLAGIPPRSAADSAGRRAGLPADLRLSARPGGLHHRARDDAGTD